VNDKKNGEKIIPFSRGVEPTTRKHDDGSEEIISGSFTVHLASVAVVALFGVNRATAAEYKRVADHGFTETEVKRMRNNGPFSTDPSIDCDRIVSMIRMSEEMMIQDIKWALQQLLRVIAVRKGAAPKYDFMNKDSLLKIIGNVAEQIRLYNNFELAEELKHLRLSENKKRDKERINEITDVIKARSIKKSPE
jgi:hypothetical protein